MHSRSSEFRTTLASEYAPLPGAPLLLTPGPSLGSDPGLVMVGADPGREVEGRQEGGGGRGGSKEGWHVAGTSQKVL